MRENFGGGNMSLGFDDDIPLFRYVDRGQLFAYTFGKGIFPKRKKGISDPRVAPKSINCWRDNPHSHQWFNTVRTVAASELPPPKPAPVGIFLSNEISTPNFELVCFCSKDAARYARSCSGRISPVGVWSMIRSSERGFR